MFPSFPLYLPIFVFDLPFLTFYHFSYISPHHIHHHYFPSRAYSASVSATQLNVCYCTTGLYVQSKDLRTRFACEICCTI